MEAAYKQKALQEPSQIQNAWVAGITGAKMTPERVTKTKAVRGHNNDKMVHRQAQKERATMQAPLGGENSK